IQSGNVAQLGSFYGYELTKPADAVGPLIQQHHGEADYWILTVSDADSAGDQPAGLEKLDQIDVIFGFEAGKPPQGDSGAAVKPRILPAPYHKAKDLMRIRQYFDEHGVPGTMTDEALALRADVKYDDELDAAWEKRQIQLEKLATDEANQLID